MDSKFIIISIVLGVLITVLLYRYSLIKKTTPPMIEDSSYFNLIYPRITKVIEREQLESLSDNEYKFKDINVLELIGLLEYENPNFPNFNKFLVVDDIMNCSNDLRFFTSQIYLLRPNINNPFKEIRIFEEQKKFTYYKTREDWLYSVFISCCFEKLYNFWDRIGDVLAFAFDVPIKEKGVDFPRSIDKMVQLDMLTTIDDFKFLVDFRNNEFENFNDIRKEIVHYSQYEAKYKHDFFESDNDKDKITELWEEKKGMPEYFKKHLELLCEGYYHLYKLIELCKETSDSKEI